MTTDGGPAFPRPSVPITDDLRDFGQPGMSLRQWFAGCALTGLLANGSDEVCAIPEIIEDAYKFADAMLETRTEP